VSLSGFLAIGWLEKAWLFLHVFLKISFVRARLLWKSIDYRDYSEQLRLQLPCGKKKPFIRKNSASFQIEDLARSGSLWTKLTLPFSQVMIALGLRRLSLNVSR